MIRLRMTVASALVLPLALAGCGDDPQPKMPPPSASSPSTPAPSASTDPAVEPTLPPEAEGKDEAAAEAFIRYYYDLINYAQRTGDVKSLRAASLAGCDFCTSGADYVRDLYDNGGRQLGGGYSISEAQVTLATSRRQESERSTALIRDRVCSVHHSGVAVGLPSALQCQRPGLDCPRDLGQDGGFKVGEMGVA